MMSNLGFDGRVKIGKSIKDLTMDRVEELNLTTSVSERFPALSLSGLIISILIGEDMNGLSMTIISCVQRPTQ